MNKQEFQRKIKNMKRPKFFNAITLDEAYEAGFEEAKNNALFNSCFLDEPEKPVVPQFVADFYESIKDDFEDKLYELCLKFNNDSEDFTEEFWVWFNCCKNEPIQTLVKMKLFGYGVEKEKLYTVEIPNPNKTDVILALGLYNNGRVAIFSFFKNFWKYEKHEKQYKLTEAEIKEDFEWAFRWAKEVK